MVCSVVRCGLAAIFTVVFLTGGCFGLATVDQKKLAVVNQQFQHNVIQSAIQSLDDILAVVNVSTALGAIQKEVESKHTSLAQSDMTTFKLHEELMQCYRDGLGDYMQSCGECYESCFDRDHVCLDINLKKLEREMARMEETQENRGFDQRQHSTSSSKDQIDDGVKYIDSIHKEVNKIATFLLQLLSQLSPSVKSNQQLLSHLEKKFKMSSREILDVFESLKFLPGGATREVAFDDAEVSMARRRVERLLRSMNSRESALINEDELIPLVRVSKKKEGASVWNEVAKTVKKAWDRTKDITGRVWDKTKDISSTAYCSVKSVFFRSDCDKRKRRSVREDEEEEDQHPTCERLSLAKEIKEKSIKCRQRLSCDTCQSYLLHKQTKQCQPEDRKLREQQRQNGRVENQLTKAMLEAEMKRIRLLHGAKVVFSDNLWIVPLSMILQGEEGVGFKMDVITYEPSDFYQQDGGNVFYRGVQMRFASAISGGTWGSELEKGIGLEPLNVHNGTQVALVASDAFVSFFKQLPEVKETARLLMQDVDVFGGL